MATRLVSTTIGSQPTGEPDPNDTPSEDLPQDNLILEFNVIIWVLVGVSGFFFFLRSYCKITRQRGLWWDDHVMGLAWVRVPVPIRRRPVVAVEKCDTGPIRPTMCSLLTAAQLTLVVSGTFGSISTTMGFGHHSWNVDTQGPSFSKLLLIMNHTGFWSILGTAWSKTGFAITLLRISEGRIRWVIWAVIVSVNIVLYLGACFLWLQCNPPAKTYTPWLEGECWDPQVIIAYNSFSAGMPLSRIPSRPAHIECLLGVYEHCLLVFSVVWSFRYHPRHPSVVDHRAPFDEHEGEDRAADLHEPGNLVSRPRPLSE